MSKIMQNKSFIICQISYTECVKDLDSLSFVKIVTTAPAASEKNALKVTKSDSKIIISFL